MPGERPEDVVAEFQRVLDDLAEREPGIEGELEMTLERPGTEVPEGSPLVQGLLRAGDSHGVEPCIEGMTATCSICRASCGRCSLIRSPGTVVSIGLKSPPLGWSGFMSKVSVWLGPPGIQSRMQARLRDGDARPSAASV